MKIELECGDVHFEWFDWKPVEIDTDNFDYFVIHYRLDSWHLIGFKYDKKSKEWNNKELSKCQASFLSLAKFIAIVDKPISKVVNYHNSSGFHQKLYELLKLANDINALKVKDGNNE